MIRDIIRESLWYAVFTGQLLSKNERVCRACFGGAICIVHRKRRKVPAWRRRQLEVEP